MSGIKDLYLGRESWRYSSIKLMQIGDVIIPYVMRPRELIADERLLVLEQTKERPRRKTVITDSGFGRS